MESVVLFVVTSENLFFIHHEWANMMNNGGWIAAQQYLANEVQNKWWSKLGTSLER